MKYLLILFMAVISFHCSPKFSPDAGWGRNRWVLVEMKGVPVQQSGGRRDAFINFEVEQKLFRGNGGCNQVNGTYTVDKNSIHFRDVISTKMSCNDIEFENTFLNALANINRYEIKGDDLHLKNKREVLLILRAK